MDEEAASVERSSCVSQWRCYAKYVNSQQILLTFLPATFSGAPQTRQFFLLPCPQSAKMNPAALFKCSDVLTLMASGLEAEPQSHASTQEDTLTASNKSRSDSLSGSTSGLERSESAVSLRRSSSSGHVPPRSPVLSPQALTEEQDGWDQRASETETGTSGSGWFNADVQISSAEKLYTSGKKLRKSINFISYLLDWNLLTMRKDHMFMIKDLVTMISISKLGLEIMTSDLEIR